MAIVMVTGDGDHVNFDDYRGMMKTEFTDHSLIRCRSEMSLIAPSLTQL